MFGLGLGLGIHRHSNANPYAFPFISRVESDGGIIRDKVALFNLTNYLQSMMPNTKLLYCPELGVKLRTSGINNYVTTLYDIGPAMLDGAQTTALNQPFLSGNIAPNEKYAMKFTKGETLDKFVTTSTPIVFNETDSWSLSILLKCNDAKTTSLLRTEAGGRIEFVNEAVAIRPKGGSGYIFYIGGALSGFHGKEVLLTFTYKGGVGGLFINGIYKQVTATPGIFEFNQLKQSYLYPYDGHIKYVSIRDIVLTNTQVAEEYTYLRSLFPEIENVKIGDQYWATSNCEMTCTPQGNVIQEIQAATNVEKITNVADREFSSDTGFWIKTRGVTISDGVVHYENVTSYNGGLRKILLEVGKRYLFTYTIKNWVSGSVALFDGNAGITIDTTGNGTYSRYILSTGTTAMITSTESINKFDIDNISIQEVGWTDSANLYNYTYANTTGTAEQKEYAAVKAAAMWCYYKNDPTIGAVYGKLYNWYAVKLLQMDIDYYNAANLTSPWGWRVPASADFNTLISYLGGNSVAGGKLKKEGSIYWGTNIGATNEFWFSAIGGGYRDTYSAAFTGMGFSATFRSVSQNSLELVRTTVESTFNVQSNISGYSLRLIKS